MKTYFTEIDEEISYAKSDILLHMQAEGIPELKAWEAVPVHGTGFFFCKDVMEVGEVGESCGKQCEAYSPRNGKNGRCRHSGGVYEKGKELTFKI